MASTSLTSHAGDPGRGCSASMSASLQSHRRRSMLFQTDSTLQTLDISAPGSSQERTRETSAQGRLEMCIDGLGGEGGT